MNFQVWGGKLRIAKKVYLDDIQIYKPKNVEKDSHGNFYGDKAVTVYTNEELNMKGLPNTLVFVSVVDVTQIPFSIAVGPCYYVKSGRLDTLSWFDRALFANTIKLTSTNPSLATSKSSWWMQPNRQWRVGILASVTDTCEHAICGATELLFFAVSDSTGLGTINLMVQALDSTRLTICQAIQTIKLTPSYPETTVKLSSDIGITYHDTPKLCNTEKSEELDELTKIKLKTDRLFNQVNQHQKQISSYSTLTAPLKPSSAKSPSCHHHVQSSEGSLEASATTAAPPHAACVAQSEVDVKRINKKFVAQKVRAQLAGMDQEGNGTVLQRLFQHTFAGTTFAFRDYINSTYLQNYSDDVDRIIDHLMKIFSETPIRASKS